MLIRKMDSQYFWDTFPLAGGDCSHPYREFNMYIGWPSKAEDLE